MKALTVTRFEKKGLAGIELLDIAKPQPKPGQLLVRMKAAAFNPADLHIASGEMSMMSPVKTPLTLGVDGAGVVELVGAGANAFRVGDEVCFYTGLVWSGTCAEYIVVDATSCACKPAEWSFAQAGASPLALLCADLALERAEVKSGQRILVHGGGGSVGSAAIFLANQRGALVDSTGSQSDKEFIEQLGVRTLYDYRTTALSGLPRAQYDMVLDGMGGSMFMDSLPLIKSDGTIASLKVMTGLDDMKKMGMQPPFIFKFLLPLLMRKYIRAARKSGVRVNGVATYQDGGRLSELVQLASKQGFNPRIDRCFTLSDALGALLHFAKGKTRGKVVLEM